MIGLGGPIGMLLQFRKNQLILKSIDLLGAVVNTPKKSWAVTYKLALPAGWDSEALSL